MNTIVLSPDPESFPEKPEYNPKRTPQRDQTHICHDGIHKPASLNPWGDEFGETIGPEVLIDSDCNENAPGNGFVRVDSVSGSDSG